MKPERQNGIESLTADQMVTNVGTIRAAVLAQLKDMSNSLDTEHLEMLNQLSTRCARAFERFDGLVEKQQNGDEVRVNIFKLAYDIINDVRDEVDGFLKMTPAERDEYIRQFQPIDLEALVTSDDTAPAEAPDTPTTPDTTDAASVVSVADTAGQAATPAPQTGAAAVDTAAAHKDPTTASAPAPAEVIDPALLKEEVERLKHMDEAILYVDGDKKNGFKGLAALRADIETLFDADGQSEKSKLAFYSAKFRKNASFVARERKLLKNATPEQRKEIWRSIEDAYRIILTNAATWLNNKKVYDEGDGAEKIPDRGVSEINEEIKDAEESFLILEEQHKDEPGFKELDSYKSVAAIFDQIKNNAADDPNLSRILEEQLSNLGEALDKLFLEVAGEEDFDDILNEQASDPDDKAVADFLGGVEVIESDTLWPADFEAGSEASEKVKAQFLAFMTTNQAKIDEELARPGGRTLFKIIYEDFYGASPLSAKYSEDEPSYVLLAKKFSEQTTELQNSLLQRTLEPGSAVTTVTSSYWLNAQVNEFASDTKIGRFYLNTKPEVAHQVFTELLDVCVEKNLHCQMKMPMEASAHAFNRADKIVFYFDSKEDAEVLAIVEDIHARFKDDFVSDTPKFTAELPNSTGEMMSGVGFGEEPIAERTSFGNIRSEILADVFASAKMEGLSIDDPNFDFETVFENACTARGVDSKNPAFNSVQNSADFTELKSRLGITSVASIGTVTPDVFSTDPSAVTPGVLSTYPGVATPEPVTVPEPVPASIGGVRVAEREYRRVESLRAKQELRDIKKQYLDALEVHQQQMNNRGMFEKIRSLGFAPELPPALKALEAEYLVRRKDYAKGLDARLSQRSDKFTLSQDDMKRAFARKFIMRPQEDLLKLQERNFLSPETSAKWKRIAGKLAEHKWTIRAASVLLAGAAGAATGGATLAFAGAAGTVGAATGGTALAFAGAAGMQGIKIAGSAASGSLAGGAANILTQKLVDKAMANLPKIAEGVEKNFSIENLNALDSGLMSANKAIKDAEKYQKVATVVAGGLAGFAAGSAFADNVPDSIEAPTRPAASTAPALPTEDQLASMRTSQVTPQAVAPVTTSPVAAVAAAAELPPQPSFVQSIAIPFDSREGGLRYEHRIAGISFGPEFKPAALNQLQTQELSSFVKIKANDFLAAHPNVTEANLEKQLLEVVQKRFGADRWWSDAPIKSVDVSKLETVLVNGSETTPTVAAAAPATESVLANRYQISPEQLRGEYTVKSGDTLWKIAEKQFADQLKDITDPSERKAVLDELFDRVRANPHLLQSLSLESINDIDKIKAGESIELSGLQGELAAVLEKKDVVELFQKSAPLSVEADADVKSVPIKVVERPVPAAVTELMLNDKPYTEPVPTKTLPTKPVITPEITTSTKGYYEMSPEHVRTEIRQYFGNANNFAAAVETAADKIDNRAYDFFEIFSNTYESPYNLFREMTMARYAELQAMPNPQLRAFLTEHKIKYEAYLEWTYEIKELTDTIPHAKTDTIGSMFEQLVFQNRVDEKLSSNLYRN